MKLNELAIGYASAITFGISMLALGILGNLGIYMGAVEQMQKWHLFFSLDILGIITGILEAAVISFIFGYLFGFIYNKFLKGPVGVE